MTVVVWKYNQLYCLGWLGSSFFRDKRFDSERQLGLLLQSNVLYICTYLKYVWKHVILVHRYEVKQGFVSGSEPSLDFSLLY